MLAPEVEAEIAALAARYGAPRRAAVELSGRQFDPIGKADRYGEVCMVVRRPNGRLLTAIKTFYPHGAYRLLTGGVGHGESIEAALLREVDEETGLAVIVRRFLAVIEYPFGGQEPGTRGQDGEGDLYTSPRSPAPGSHAFATFAFLLDEVGGTLAARDPAERIRDFRELEAAELPALAETLDNLPGAASDEIGGSWRDWGRFRAVVHRVVYDELRELA